MREFGIALPLNPLADRAGLPARGLSAGVAGEGAFGGLGRARPGRCCWAASDNVGAADGQHSGSGFSQEIRHNSVQGTPSAGNTVAQP